MYSKLKKLSRAGCAVEHLYKEMNVLNSSDKARELLTKVEDQMLIDLVNRERQDRNDLTPEEVVIGTTKGKIRAINAYRDRTGNGLVESKQVVEKYFSDNGLTFGYPKYESPKIYPDDYCPE